MPSRTCTLVEESLPTSMYSLNFTASSPVPASNVTSATRVICGASASAVTEMSTPSACTERSPSASRNAPAETYSRGSAMDRTACLWSSSSSNSGASVSEVSYVESCVSTNAPADPGVAEGPSRTPMSVSSMSPAAEALAVLLSVIVR